MMKPILKMSMIVFGALLLLVVAEAVEHDRTSLAAQAQSVQEVTLKIDGMGCASCVKEIRSALLKVPGVESAQVKIKKSWLFFSDYSDARAVVAFEPAKTTVGELIKAIEGASSSMFTYHAKLIE